MKHKLIEWYINHLVRKIMYLRLWEELLTVKINFLIPLLKEEKNKAKNEDEERVI